MRPQLLLPRLFHPRILWNFDYFQYCVVDGWVWLPLLVMVVEEAESVEQRKSYEFTNYTKNFQNPYYHESSPPNMAKNANYVIFVYILPKNSK